MRERLKPPQQKRKAPQTARGFNYMTRPVVRPLRTRRRVGRRTRPGRRVRAGGLRDFVAAVSTAPGGGLRVIARRTLVELPRTRATPHPRGYDLTARPTAAPPRSRAG